MQKSKNPYKPFICLEGLQCDEIGKAYEEGQQNPDPKQYAKREELEKAMKKARNSLRNNYLLDILDIVEVIRTQGLEE